MRVVFGDADDLVSDWLPVLFPTTLLNQVYGMPDVDEHVVCLLDEHAEFGVVLGAIYSDVTAPPIQSLEKVHIKFKDGTTVQYDRAAHTLSIDLVADGADVAISTTRNVSVTSSAGNVTVNVAEGQHVFLGGAGGAVALATRPFVEEIYANHLHPTPAGISGKPIPIGTETAWPHCTEKSVSR